MTGPLTNEQIEARAKEARDLVKSKAGTSALAAALPIPLLDVGTDMKLLNELTEDIEEIFGITHDEVAKFSDDMKTRAAVMISSMGGEFVARKTIGYAVNKIGRKNRKAGGSFGVIPIVTQGSTALISYFLMKKLGYDHIDKCVEYLESKNIDGSVQDS
ncbi:hypothetical protein GCM10007275_08630 [Jeotgalicoccus coquinae]|uniref:Uncharacterized protein (DUF697 family) n=1 Tax=Jeotgalicoccus coquinae TaxID=709509 RepID=A0A6V7RK63_9STAP|nr:hypothetical protein [Jeotgalicoccus coquinae]MBB6422469.1 uncharacterized protein (DUF697 family) [Jeotgalicoccus coquinae]GGE15635.1 hypothetical protein GCM10007275_08630 [Jeotgalicoccus coquinae]CAD2078517.1 hypothetical protein JEOCOQ751_01190 [Jeotgalicoccus coquinae]